MRRGYCPDSCSCIKALYQLCPVSCCSHTQLISACRTVATASYTEIRYQLRDNTKTVQSYRLYTGQWSTLISYCTLKLYSPLMGNQVAFKAHHELYWSCCDTYLVISTLKPDSNGCLPSKMPKPKSSVIAAFATFMSLAFSKILVTALLATYSTSYHINNKQQKRGLYDQHSG